MVMMNFRMLELLNRDGVDSNLLFSLQEMVNEKSNIERTDIEFVTVLVASRLQHLSMRIVPECVWYLGHLIDENFELKDSLQSEVSPALLKLQNAAMTQDEIAKCIWGVVKMGGKWTRSSSSYWKAVIMDVDVWEPRSLAHVLSSLVGMGATEGIIPADLKAFFFNQIYLTAPSMRHQAMATVFTSLHRMNFKWQR